MNIITENKVVRSICWFTESARFPELQYALNDIETRLIERGYTIQTKRICFNAEPVSALASLEETEGLYLSVGSLDYKTANEQLDDFLQAKNVSFNLDLTTSVDLEDVEVLIRIINEAPENTFNFAYTFQNCLSSPFFPSATFERPGFAIGLQPTDLSEGCADMEEWLSNMHSVWGEICSIFVDRADFLGIDASIAPLFRGKSSLVHFVKRISGGFSRVVTTDLFVKLTQFLSTHNPKPIGLCGLMLPCLEDFELAEEYEAGQFSIERNIFLSLHSGLGVDTYPIGINESPKRVLEVLRLLQMLSVKYEKSLSARFVSDGKARIGDRTDFQNQYLRDVRIRPL
jgi:hypothetical protein